MYIRLNTYDDFILDEREEYRPLFGSNESGLLMDIGGNIGSTARLANDEYSLEVITYEPEKDNFEILSMNTKNSNSIMAINSAIGTGNKKVKLFIDNGTFKAKHSICKRNFKDGFNSIEVNQLDFKEQLEKFKPLYLKIDIEGGEFDLDLKDIPINIKYFALEIHLIENDFNKFLKLFNDVKKQFDFYFGEDINELNIKEKLKKDSDSAKMFIFYRR